MNNIILGIDLGTTFSVAAYVNDKGKAEVIPLECGTIHKPSIVPSVIWADDRRVLVGRKAVEQKKETIEYIKSYMGRYERDKDGQLRVDESTGMPIPTWSWLIDDESYNAEELSAIILAKIVRDANHYLRNENIIDRDVRDVVITVPAHFDNLARKATQTAGRLAGLNVINIINEPTAAAITYGIGRNQERVVMVFDLGGGTFDVTLMRVKGSGNVNVLASSGHMELGGRDWDIVLAEYLTSEIKDKFCDIWITDEMNSIILEKAREAKLNLSIEDRVMVKLSLGDIDTEIMVTNEIFKNRSIQLLQNSKATCELVLKEAIEKDPKIHSWLDVDEMVLVGGSSRMPIVKEWVKEKIVENDKTRIVEGDYDLAIALGAAIYAKHRGRIVDVSPKTLAVLVEKNRVKEVEKMILKDTSLPAEKTNKFTAPPYAVVEVVQGEGDSPAGYRQIGTIELNNTERKKVEITYQYSENGIIHVFVKGKNIKKHELELNVDYFKTIDDKFAYQKQKVNQLLKKLE